MPIYKIHHSTRYEYDRIIQESINEIKIFPVQSAEQEVVQQEVEITGNPEIQFFYDYWGNRTGVFNLLPPHRELVIDSHLIVRTSESGDLQINFISGFEDMEREWVDDLKMLELKTPEPIRSQDKILGINAELRKADDSVAVSVKSCSDYISGHFGYVRGITNVETTVDEILEKKGGVCQDFAHLLLQLLRTMNIPSRYVSGYICPNREGLRGEGATHAWVEAWIPGSGWAGIDPTNGVWVTNTHVKLATGRHFADCSPVKGSFKGTAVQQLSVLVSVDYEDGHHAKNLNHVDLSKEKPSDSPLYSPAGQQ